MGGVVAVPLEMTPAARHRGPAEALKTGASSGSHPDPLKALNTYQQGLVTPLVILSLWEPEAREQSFLSPDQDTL